MKRCIRSYCSRWVLVAALVSSSASPQVAGAQEADAAPEIAVSADDLDQTTSGKTFTATTSAVPRSGVAFQPTATSCHPTRLMIKPIVAAASATSSTVSSFSSVRSSATAPVKGEVIITMNGGADVSVHWPSDAAQKISADNTGASLDTCAERRLACEELKATLGDVECSPVPTFTARRVTNDPDASNLWAHNSIKDFDLDIHEAWDYALGTGVVLAVADTGVMYTHPDLSGTVYVNAAEVSDGRDNDNNGYVDDIKGYDFINGDNNARPDTTATNDDRYHGTHIAGILAATGNNSKGIVGGAWGAKYLPLKVADVINVNGQLAFQFSTDAIVASINYVTAMAKKTGKRFVVNMSFGSNSYNEAFDIALQAADQAGVVLVAAAGNDNLNNDQIFDFPSSHPNVISVAATTPDGTKTDFSNYGLFTVDIAAPGVGIYSTMNDGGYEAKAGTSMAAPEVAAVAGLILQKCSSSTNYMTPTYLNDVLYMSAQPLLGPQFNTSGLVNAYEALKNCGALSAVYDASDTGHQNISISNPTTATGRFVAWADHFDGSRTELGSGTVAANSTKTFHIAGSSVSMTPLSGLVSVLGTSGLTAKIVVSAPNFPVTGQTWRAHNVNLRPRKTVSESIAFSIPTTNTSKYRPMVQLFNHGFLTQTHFLELYKGTTLIGSLVLDLQPRRYMNVNLFAGPAAAGSYTIKVKTPNPTRETPATATLFNRAIQ